jgi:hypothetical protein
MQITMPMIITLSDGRVVGEDIPATISEEEWNALPECDKSSFKRVEENELSS